jgi:sugar lactone lactonase YvrE
MEMKRTSRIFAIILGLFLFASCKKEKQNTTDTPDPACSGEDCYHQVVSTFSGNGVAASVDGSLTTATFNNPTAIVFDVDGNMFVADYYGQKIRKISTSGQVTTFAGSGAIGAADGTGTAASFNYPFGLAIDATGNLFVADFYNNKIRKITPSGVVTTFAGSGTTGSADGTGTAATFNYPSGIAIDSVGNLFVVDQGNHKIRKITSSGVVTTFAGSASSGFTNGTGTGASFSYPYGIVIDSVGNLFVGEYGNHAIRKITTAGVVTTIAGSGNFGSADGNTGNVNPAAASFNGPIGLCIDASGNMFVADYSNYKIRKITPEGIVSTYAGTGSAGSANGKGDVASFYDPAGLAIDASGALYVADQSNNKIRKIVRVHK